MIQQLIPAFTPLWQVSAGPAGEVIMIRVVCIALAQDNEGVRFPAPMVPAEHLRVADADLSHVAYAASDDPGPWEQKCKDKRAALVKAEAEQAGKPKIIVPSHKVVTAKELVN